MSFRLAFLLCLTVLLFLARSIQGLSVEVTAVEAEMDFTPEYNRVFRDCLTLSASGSLELNQRYVFRGGLSLWQTAGAWEVDAAAGFQAKLLSSLPLYASVSYYFNTLPLYETVSHTALPLIGLRFRYGGFALGTALRFSSFFNESAIFESVISLEGYVNFYNTEAFRIGLRCANYDAFTAGNFGAYRLSLDSRLGVTKRFSLINALTLLQTGSITLAAEFYGLAYTMGALIRW
jgi:hypothetical protein